jgi:RNA polymerase-binding transcription factor DksA
MILHKTNFEKELRARRATLRQEIRATLLRADSERYASIADRLGDSEDRPLAEVLAEVSEAEAARDIAEIADIDLALQRLANGTYGKCVDCSRPIPEERLKAFPTAKRCLPCQQRHEQHRN